MEAAPPTYEKATAPQKWDLIAQYLPSNDLCSAALVCEEWHTVFAPHLWGNPASHFGTENDRVYVALTKFQRTLLWARLHVRSLTHTLHMPPAHAQIYYGPHADWLREVLHRLPNLQSLIVRGLPFFDHASLNALRCVQPVGGEGYQFARAFGLRLLDASRCANTTAIGLSQALDRFPFMLYLDLSFTFPARDHAVLKKLRSMTGLQVLKLRGISLRDEDVEVLAPAISTRIKSLDMRDNQLTDRGVHALIQHCFSPQRSQNTSTFSAFGDRSPSLLRYLGAEMFAIYRGEQYEAYIRKAFTIGFVNRLAIEDTPESGTGITHLAVSSNRITVKGASELIKSGRLNVLDIGFVAPDLEGYALESMDNLAYPGAEKLISVLIESAGRTLTFLRIDHRLVTEATSTELDDLEMSSGLAELPDYQPSVLPRGIAELPAESIYELPADVPERTELAGDSVHTPTVLAGMQAPSHRAEDTAEYRARRESEIAPEVADPPGYEDVTSHGTAGPLSYAFDIAKARRGSEVAPEPFDPPQYESDHSIPLSTAPVISPLDEGPSRTVSSTTSTIPHRGRQRSYSSVVSERMSRVKTHLTESKLYPGALPRLTNLVLTDVPPFAPTPVIGERLVEFIHDCADETRLAQLQAQLDYTIPPGRKQSQTALLTRANTLFPLQEIVLEMAHDEPRKPKGAASTWRHHGTKSVTQDHDSEALAAAADTDFSFFGEYDDEMPSLEPTQSVPFPAMSGLEVGIAPSPALPPQYEDEAPVQPRHDVIAKIAEFRKSKKAAYQAVIACGEEQPNVEGYWGGNVKVIRPSKLANPMDEDDEVVADYYGNVHSTGGIYR
ncbi:hypothetical protein AAFC00_001133 [Neodothiora populina]|uniref:F-box domain-containing protein n=1 Tax=Neodothiora populina TaxID=2781224 RepID=A0ABR3PMY4_9PEZI